MKYFVLTVTMSTILLTGCGSTAGRTIAAVLTGGQSEILRAASQRKSEIDPAEELVIGQIKQLDEAHQAGQLADAEYWKLRNELVTQLSTLLRDREHLSEAKRQALLQSFNQPPPTPHPPTQATITDPFGMTVGHIRYETEPSN